MNKQFQSLGWAAIVLGAAALMFFAAVCDRDSSPTGISTKPERLKYISGNNQVGAPKSRLVQPLVVQVLGTDGDPVPAQKVRFEVSSASGTLGAGEQFQEVVTNANGMTSVYLTLGDTTDNPFTVVATSMDYRDIDLSGSPVTFTATARKGAQTGGTGTQDSAYAADSIAVISGSGQMGEVGSVLPLPIVFAVYDDDGDLMANASVTITVTQGFGYIANEGETPVPPTNLLTVTTNSMGLAVVTWKLGPGPDLVNTLVAEVRRNDGTVDSASASAEALPVSDTANRILIMSGNNQGYNGEYGPGALLPLPLVVMVVDTTRKDAAYPSGRPVSNFPVIFTAYSRDGRAAVSSSEGCPGGCAMLTCTTNEDGLAAVRLTLGSTTGIPEVLDSLRNKTLVVAVAVLSDGTQDSVMFTATQVHGAASDISEVGSTSISAIVGTPVTVTVLVTDGSDNAKFNIPVTFSVGGGSATVSQTPVNTSTRGYASTQVTANAAGTITINASAISQYVSFTITAATP